MATKPAVRSGSAERQPPTAAPIGDIRSGRPWLLSPSPLRSFLRRVLSVASLVFLDLAGLTLGLYAALVIRELYHGPYDAKELVILQDLYELVEKAIDRCRDAGNVVVQVVLKYS